MINLKVYLFRSCGLRREFEVACCEKKIERRKMPSSFQPPVSGDPHDPYEKYRVSEIQKDKEPRDASEGTEPFRDKKRGAFVAYAILVLQKFQQIASGWFGLHLLIFLL